jgi:tellurite resistance protein
MTANHHVSREELARAHHLIWSTKRFRRKSGETVGRLIDRMKRLLEAEDVAAVMERAAQTVPSALRPSTFALVADLLLADGKMDARERKFLHPLATNFNLRPRVADDVIAAILVKNHL